MHRIEKIRLSVGSAAVLSLVEIQPLTYPTTCYMMTYTHEKCIGKCGFCPQGQCSDPENADKLSRIQWPDFTWQELLDRLDENQKLSPFNIQNTSIGKFQRLCLQVLNYNGFEQDVLEIIHDLHERYPDLKISAAIPPVSKEMMIQYHSNGLERIAVALDACTKPLFADIKGSNIEGPYRWETHQQALTEALSIFGKGFVTTHFIVGLGETEEDMIKALWEIINQHILPGIFMFTPVRGTPMKKAIRPNILQFRHIQLARYLLLTKKIEPANFVFDNGTLVKIKSLSTVDLQEIIEKNTAFLTAGCPGCNRPYYTARPGQEQDGYPRPLTTSEKRIILKELGSLVDGEQEITHQWDYIPFQTHSGPINMAIDEFLLEEIIAKRRRNTLRFYQWKPSTATIGRNQELNAEIDEQKAKEYGIDIVRRISGGGAVLHEQSDEITYAVIAHNKDLPKISIRHPDIPRDYDRSIPERYQILLEALAQGLEKLQIPIDIGKIHCPALLAQGKKISGNAQAIRKNVLLQHGTILLDVSPERMYQILKAPVGVSYTRMVQSVRAKVTGINQLHNKLPIEKTILALKEGFEEVLGIQLHPATFSESDWEQIYQIAQEKYANEKWTKRY